MASERFGAYELTNRIAMGGMAEIFRAERLGEAGFSKTVVIKRVLPFYAQDEAFVSMFIDEAVLAAKLNHPNVASVFDFGVVDGAYFIAMEYIEGLDLRRLVQCAESSGERLGSHRAAQIAVGMARGLGHAHERTDAGRPLRIVHRDVSPHNVIVSLTGEVKVVDFGIARAAARATRTSTGVIKGKLSYMAPEQARGDELDARCDIYALGIVFWEMLTGKRAYVGDNEMQVLRRVQSGEIPSIDTILPELDRDLVRIVSKLLEADVTRRYQRMRDVERDLSKVIYQLGGESELPLDEYVQKIMPPDVLQSLRSNGEAPRQQTQSLPSFGGSSDSGLLDSDARRANGAETKLEAVERNASTLAQRLSSANTSSLPNTPLPDLDATLLRSAQVAITLPVSLPSRGTRIGLLAVSVVAVIGFALIGVVAWQSGWFSPDTEQVAVVELKPAVSQALPPVIVPPQPASAPASAPAPAPAPASATIESPKAPVPQLLPPKRAKAAESQRKVGYLMFNCTANHMVSDNGRTLAASVISSSQATAFEAGFHHLVIQRRDNGQSKSIDVTLRAKDSEMIDCQ